MLLYSVPHICGLWPWYVAVLDPLIAPIVLPITQIAMTGSVYSVVAVALERYFNICKPFRANWVSSELSRSVSTSRSHLKSGNFDERY